MQLPPASQPSGLAFSSTNCLVTTLPNIGPISSRTTAAAAAAATAEDCYRCREALADSAQNSAFWAGRAE